MLYMRGIYEQNSDLVDEALWNQDAYEAKVKKLFQAPLDTEFEVRRGEIVHLGLVNSP